MTEVIHLSVRSKAVQALECERDTLFEKANRISKDQQAIWERAMNDVALLSKEQERILLQMESLDEAIAKLMKGVS